MDMINNRYGIINMHSLVINQFSAEIYRELIEYSWHDTDPDFIVSRTYPLTTSQITFGFDRRRNPSCSVGGCMETAFMRCSHCGKQLCLKHFLERICFHDSRSNENPFRTGLVINGDHDPEITERQVTSQEDMNILFFDDGEMPDFENEGAHNIMDYED